MVVDRKMVMAAVLKNEREVVMAAVKHDGWALWCASDELKNDREVVNAAVQQKGRALKYASAERWRRFQRAAQ